MTLASAINPLAVQALVNRMVPEVLWEYGVDNASDPTYVHKDISWPTDPDAWEAARSALAGIIGTGALVAPVLDLPSTLPVTAQIRASYPPGYPVSTYQWTLTPFTTAESGGTAAQHATARSGVSIYTLATSDGTAPLAAESAARLLQSLGDGDRSSRPRLTARDRLCDAGGFRAVRYARLSKTLARRYARGKPITFDRLTSDATIAIFTLAAHQVITLRSSGGVATWNLENDSGNPVASGIYLYVVKTRDGASARGQLAVIR